MSSPCPTVKRPTIIRRQFEELHPRDRKVKTNRRDRIQANWGCDIGLVIPQPIRPRIELKKGAKVRVGDLVGDEEIWWNWSVEVLRSLEELSTMLAGNLPMAQELLLTEVHKRQKDATNPQRKVAELLLGDVQRIAERVKIEQAKEAAMTGSGQQDLDIKNSQETPREHGAGAKEEKEEAKAQVQAQVRAQAQYREPSETGSSSNIMASPHVKHAYDRRHIRQSNSSMNNMELSTLSTPRTHRFGPRQNLSTQQSSVGLEIDVAEIRVRAKQLRAQAMRLEAEAMELQHEANMARQALNSL
ncbi:hypothetical protein AUEXF2481DRAFT_41744 [Aureobasidium subglaciale EXF-2481]|uniref:Uncharacterized protein n=1 Tax=Aureobasidium subglaciale (strain EXF-2481) TaxID=1043005 RepID=A0A074YBV7_AURSE|nr:uncharacterized protein AUEXF2481DRAFT_41744 [Aureobasidium subglaciale EXF-2481]KAI5212812.1 hypothetical protein E4T38_00176 [Aureobasidium subglaciale]KAI5232516.1 hypothetical protein E4T40_00175 [Aureobasidium subglaciale]KAI5234851.1 hypothetical protein E4T41_00175 [Aureobasidium subglaciale]KAI5268301.1 hypothetical protein E4T46_00175 [Aureobasidium subglaciale]KEQ93509.1 hypothetical protein AUEXF2481DRAFT_41744 [Aureobasidium subglaciale EXF-2481]